MKEQKISIIFLCSNLRSDTMLVSRIKEEDLTPEIIDRLLCQQWGDSRF